MPTNKKIEDLRGLLSHIPATTGAKLSEHEIISLLHELENSSDPEKLSNAWFPILEAINANYCYGKFKSEHYDIIDPRNAIDDVVTKQCIADFEATASIPKNRVFAEQIATLLVVRANLAHCYPSGHYMSYTEFCSAMSDAEKFIHKHKLLYSVAHSSWCYLKAYGAQKSYDIVNQELYWTRSSLEKKQKQLSEETDELSKTYLIGTIQALSGDIQRNEKCLQTYSYDRIKNLGTAYGITAVHTLTTPQALGSIAAVATLAAYSMRPRSGI